MGGGSNTPNPLMLLTERERQSLQLVFTFARSSNFCNQLIGLYDVKSCPVKFKRDNRREKNYDLYYVRLETLRTKERNFKKTAVDNSSVGKLTLALVGLEFFNALGLNRFRCRVGRGFIRNP